VRRVRVSTVYHAGELCSAVPSIKPLKKSIFICGVKSTYFIILNICSNKVLITQRDLFVFVNCTLKCRIAMAKTAFNKKRGPFTGTLDLELRKKLVSDMLHLEHGFIWC